MFHVKDFTSQNVQTVYNENELSTAVFDTIKYYREENERLKRENKEWHTKALEKANDELKDEIQFLQEKLALSYGEFSSEKEKQAYEQFEEEHMHDRLISKYNGGRAPYLVPTGTGIGTLLKVVCPICGKSRDITDISVW